MKNKQIELGKLLAEYGKNVRFAENYGDISELAASIEVKGIIQPLIVEQVENGFNILSGHRRFAALNLLVEQGKIDKTFKVPCVVQTAANDIERAAIKLLANDGQALTPYEWAAEVVRLNEKGYEINEIAKVLGKSVGYVNNLLNTWSALSDEAKKQVVSGKVSMSLAIAMKKESANDKLVSLSVQVAAAAKEVVNQKGEHVSDKVLAAAVTKTTDKIVKAASQGQSLSGNQIGADVLANIQLVKQTNKQAQQAAKDVLEGIIQPKQTKSLETFIDGLITAMNEDKRMKLVAPVLNEVLLCFEQGMDVKESVESIYKLNKTVKA